MQPWCGRAAEPADGRRSRRRFGRARLAVLSAVVLASAALSTACVGAMTKNDFDEEIRSRGGGVGQDLALDAVDAVRDELGVDAIELRSLSVAPGQVTLEVRVPGSPTDLDRYRYGTSGRYGGRGLFGPEPVAVAGSGPPLESLVFRPEDAGLNGLDGRVDAALAEADLEGGSVQVAMVGRDPAEAGPVTTITVTNVRSTIVVTFGPDGSLLGAQPA